jgi:hypothetical protein
VGWGEGAGVGVDATVVGVAAAGESVGEGDGGVSVGTTCSGEHALSKPVALPATTTTSPPELRRKVLRVMRLMLFLSCY